MSTTKCTVDVHGKQNSQRQTVNQDLVEVQRHRRQLELKMLPHLDAVYLSLLHDMSLHLPHQLLLSVSRFWFSSSVGPHLLPSSQDLFPLHQFNIWQRNCGSKRVLCFTTKKIVSKVICYFAVLNVYEHSTGKDSIWAELSHKIWMWCLIIILYTSTTCLGHDVIYMYASKISYEMPERLYCYSCPALSQC